MPRTKTERMHCTREEWREAKRRWGVGADDAKELRPTSDVGSTTPSSRISIPFGLFSDLTDYATELRGEWGWKQNERAGNAEQYAQLHATTSLALELRDAMTPDEPIDYKNGLNMAAKVIRSLEKENADLRLRLGISESANNSDEPSAPRGLRQHGRTDHG